MAKLTLQTLTSLANQTTALQQINANSELIENALENTLSRDGTQPNTMNADIDLNGYDLLNVGDLEVSSLSLDGVPVTTDTNFIPLADIYVVNSIAALKALTTSTTQVVVFVKNYYSGSIGGGGMFSLDASDTTSTEDGGTIFIDASSRRWKRSTGGLLKASYFGIIGNGATNDQTNFVNCVNQFFNNDKVYSDLDMEGIPIHVDSPISFNAATTNFNEANFVSRGRTISNLNLRVNTSGTWASGNAMLEFSGNAANGYLREFTLDNCRFDCNDEAGVIPLRLRGYYGVHVHNCSFLNFTDVGLRDQLDTDGASNHGLVVTRTLFQGNYGAPGNTIGIYLDSNDVIVDGGRFQWMNQGIVTLQGGIKITDCHFSIGSQATSSVAVRCTNPQNVLITNCDFDGSYIYFTNNEVNYAGATQTTWRKIIVTENDFVCGNNMPATAGLIFFETATANLSISDLNVSDNASIYTGTGTTYLTRFNTTGAGSWASTWYANIKNAENNTVNSANFVANQNLWRDNTSHGYIDVNGDMVHREINSGSGEGPIHRLWRDSSSPAANDYGGMYAVSMNDSNGNQTDMATAYGQMLDPTDASEDARWGFQTRISGTLGNRLYIGAGVYSVGATGGDKGTNTANFSDYYQNGVQLMRKIVKATAQSKVSDTTMAFDDELKFTAETGKNYHGKIVVWYSSPAAADIKIGLDGSGTPADIWYTIKAIGPAETSFGRASSHAAYDPTGVPVLHASTLPGGWVEIDFYLRAPSTTATFGLKWAQNTSNATGATVKAGSYILYSEW